jgi:hypothetical protein
MHFRTAREMWSATDLHRAQETAPQPLNREREYLAAMIREHEAEIARRAERIRLLRMELESLPATVERAPDSRRAAPDR